MSILSFCPLSFAFAISFSILATGSPNSVSGLPFPAVSASFPFLQDFLIWISFVAFLYGGLPFLVPSHPLSVAFMPVPDLFTSSGVFSVCHLCFSMSASIWAFSIICVFASISFKSFCPCIFLALSSASHLASFGTISIIYWAIGMYNFVYVNIFMIWYLSSLCFDICIGCLVIFES